jgi:hypothetical protein
VRAQERHKANEALMPMAVSPRSPA